MFSKIWEICSLSLVFSLLLSCGGRSDSQGTAESRDSLFYAEDTLDMVEAEEDALDEVGSIEHLDVNFDDFMFSFIRSRQLQRERVSNDIYVYDEEGNEVALRRTNLRDAFSFLDGEYYTVLYGDAAQIEEEKNSQSDVIDVERIDLDLCHVTTYTFLQEKGKWMLADLADNSFEEDELSDFLTFYAHFSEDSVFQAESIAQPLSIKMMDPEDELGFIDGTIDALQWSIFCPDVPAGVISNIRYGQSYANPRHMVLQKCGISNGMQELFTFDKTGGRWRLTAYEN
ncbi:MAG: DUF4348 domain-containing protein [Bacteroidaceae bacterium]|nr:DUF4348 domain-containing protein [Bacteroidaceae bacterium]